MAGQVGGVGGGSRGQIPAEPATQDGQIPGVVQQGGPNGVHPNGAKKAQGQLPPGGKLPEGTPLPDGKAPAGFVKDKNGNMVPATAQDIAAGKPLVDKNGQPLAAQGSRVATNPVFVNDQVEASTDSAPMVALSETPQLPEGEGVPGAETGGDFRAFVGFVEEIAEDISQPGQLTAIWARAGELVAKPEESIIADLANTEAGAAIGKSFEATFEENVRQIREGIPEDLRPQFDEGVNALRQMIQTNGPQMLMSLEACADFMIAACFRMNNSAARQMKTFVAGILSTMQKFDAGKRQEINAYQGQISTKLEASDRAQKAAEANKFWNCLLAVGLIIVAIVCAVLSVFTFGAAAAGSVAAVLAAVAMVAAITMAVVTVIQNLPAILDACGAEDAANDMRKLLSGPFGKVLMGIMIACAVCMLVCGIGGAICAASATAVAVPQAGAQVTVATSQGAVSGTVAASGTAGTMNIVSSSGATVGQITSSGTQMGVTMANGATVTALTVPSSTATVFGGAMGTTASVSGGVVNATGTTAAIGTSGAIQTATAATQVAGGGMSVARGCLQMSQAEIEYATARLSAEVQELQVNIQRVKTELDLNKLFKGDWEESIKAAEQAMNKMFQQAVQSLGAQTEANQAVANVYR